MWHLCYSCCQMLPASRPQAAAPTLLPCYSSAVPNGTRRVRPPLAGCARVHNGRQQPRGSSASGRTSSRQGRQPRQRWQPACSRCSRPRCQAGAQAGDGCDSQALPRHQGWAHKECPWSRTAAEQHSACVDVICVASAARACVSEAAAQPGPRARPTLQERGALITTRSQECRRAQRRAATRPAAWTATRRGGGQLAASGLLFASALPCHACCWRSMCLLVTYSQALALVSLLGIDCPVSPWWLTSPSPPSAGWHLQRTFWDLPLPRRRVRHGPATFALGARRYIRAHPPALDPGV